MNQTGAGLPLSTHPVKLGGRPPAEVVKEPPGIPHPGLTRPPSPSVASDQNQSQWVDEESTLSYDDEEKGVLGGDELSWNEGNLAPSTATIGPLCGSPSKSFLSLMVQVDRIFLVHNSKFKFLAFMEAL